MAKIQMKVSVSMEETFEDFLLMKKSMGLNLSEFARVCGLSRTTVYKYVSLLES